MRLINETGDFRIKAPTSSQPTTWRLIGAVLAELDDEWATSRRYLSVAAAERETAVIGEFVRVRRRHPIEGIARVGRFHNT